MKIEQHCLVEARQAASPNQSPRPDGVLPELIVIHSISLPPGCFGGPGIEQLFTNCLPSDEHAYYRTIAELKVSAHLVIYRDGKLVQFVPFNLCAWHAGESSYRGRTHCNDFSIGIELEGTGRGAYEPVQYRQLAQAVRALLKTYPSLSPERIVGHQDIAPGRKSDPGPGFDFCFLEHY